MKYNLGLVQEMLGMAKFVLSVVVVQNLKKPMQQFDAWFIQMNLG